MLTQRRVPFYFMALALVGFALISTGCGSKSGGTPTASIEGETPAATATTGGSAETTNVPAVARKAENLHPTVLIKTSAGAIKVKLNAEKSPVTVENFLDNYVSRGFYDNTVFHYVDKGMVLGGGYTATLESKTARAAIRNEADNGLKNVRGTISMARMAEYPDSASSQFFFNVTDNPTFDHSGDDATTYGYCVFGEVVEGQDVLDKMAATPVQNQGEFINTPVQPLVVESVTRLD